MPELPDVEVYKRYVDSTSLKQKVTRVQALAPKLLDGMSPQTLGRHLKGAAFTQTRRHGKYLFIRAGRAGWLILHFGMTGRIEYGHWNEQGPKYAGLRVQFDNGADMAYIAPRKLGRIAWTRDPDTFVHEKGLGPDVAALTLNQFRSLAARRQGTVKAWLMDQAAMAGLGNVYSDEVLFRAGIHPKATVQKLDRRAIERLHRAIAHVLRQAIKAQADPERMPKSFLLPHRKPGAKCPRCGGTVERITAAGRSAYYCPGCQTGS